LQEEPVYGLWCLRPLSTILTISWRRKPGYLEKTTDIQEEQENLFLFYLASKNCLQLVFLIVTESKANLGGGSRGGGGGATSPPKKIGKNMIFLRKIVIFHTKYPNNFRASLRSAQFC
jgi:hypothetical protein